MQKVVLESEDSEVIYDFVHNIGEADLVAFADFAKRTEDSELSEIVNELQDFLKNSDN